MGGREGRVIVSAFKSCAPMVRRDGSAVAGMYKVVLCEERNEREVEHDATFFNTDQEGEVSRMRRTFDALAPQVGDRVVVRITSEASRPKEGSTRSFVNDMARAIFSADA